MTLALAAAALALSLGSDPAPPPPSELAPRPALRPLGEQDARLRAQALAMPAVWRESKAERGLRGRNALLVAGGLALVGVFARWQGTRSRDPVGAGLLHFEAYGLWALAAGAGAYGAYLRTTDPPGPAR
jgi:hypothetical protein